MTFSKRGKISIIEKVQRAVLISCLFYQNSYLYWTIMIQYSDVHEFP